MLVAPVRVSKTMKEILRQLRANAFMESKTDSADQTGTVASVSNIARETIQCESNERKSLNNVFVVLVRKLGLLENPWFNRENSIFYIGGSEVLPIPLEPGEEAELIERLGSEDDLTVKSVLIERNLRLVVYIARKFENTGVNVEDLISIGTIGLIKAINTFRADKKIKLATYASRCIENEILMYLRRNTRIKTEVSIDEPLNVDWEGNELLLSDILGTDVDIIYRDIEDEVDKDLLNRALSKLSKREKKIVELRFGINADGEEHTQKEVADMLGISQSYISRLEKKIIGRLKKEMSRMV